MCKVIVKEPEKNIGFIIYNHLFSNDATYNFTVDQLAEELKQYNLDLHRNVVKREVDEYVRAGNLRLRVDGYSINK